MSGLARAPGGRLAVFRVWSRSSGPALVVPGWSVQLAFEAELEQRANQTDATARPLVPENLHSSVEMRSGDPGTILAAASAHLDLLVPRRVRRGGQPRSVFPAGRIRSIEQVPTGAAPARGWARSVVPPSQ